MNDLVRVKRAYIGRFWFDSDERERKTSAKITLNKIYSNIARSNSKKFDINDSRMCLFA